MNRQDEKSVRRNAVKSSEEYRENQGVESFEVMGVTGCSKRINDKSKRRNIIEEVTKYGKP